MKQPTRKTVQLLFTFLLIICSQISCSQTISKNQQELIGKIISVQDGDTYEILLEGNEKKRVRMAGIDAPEKGMDFSRKAADYLRTLCLGQTVTIKFTETDQYGRFIAFTYLNGGRELSREMLKAGFAWHFLKYDNSEELSNLEKEARSKNIGLWFDKYPVEPWFERKLRKKGYKSVEIKQMKINGMINTEDDVKKIPHKVNP